MDFSTLFLLIRDLKLRAEITQYIFQVPRLIPSIKMLHKNIKYLDIISYIIKSNLITSLKKGKLVYKAILKL